MIVLFITYNSLLSHPHGRTGGGVNYLTKAVSEEWFKQNAEQTHINCMYVCISKGAHTVHELKWEFCSKATNKNKIQMPNPLLKAAPTLNKAANIPPPLP